MELSFFKKAFFYLKLDSFYIKYFTVLRISFESYLLSKQDILLHHFDVNLFLLFQSKTPRDTTFEGPPSKLYPIFEFTMKYTL